MHHVDLSRMTLNNTSLINHQPNCRSVQFLFEIILVPVFSVQQHIAHTFSALYANTLSALYAIAHRSTCLFVCPSHWWINQKRLKLGSWNFYHTVSPSL